VPLFGPPEESTWASSQRRGKNALRDLGSETAPLWTGGGDKKKKFEEGGRRLGGGWKLERYGNRLHHTQKGKKQRKVEGDGKNTEAEK